MISPDYPSPYHATSEELEAAKACAYVEELERDKALAYVEGLTDEETKALFESDPDLPESTPEEDAAWFAHCALYGDDDEPPPESDDDIDASGDDEGEAS